MNALFITNPNVDYLITAYGHYFAYIYKTKKVIHNRFTPGEPHLLEVLRKIQPEWPKIPKQSKYPNTLPVLKTLAETQYGVKNLNITQKSISSQEIEELENLVAELK